MDKNNNYKEVKTKKATQHNTTMLVYEKSSINNLSIQLWLPLKVCISKNAWRTVYNHTQ